MFHCRCAAWSVLLFIIGSSGFNTPSPRAKLAPRIFSLHSQLNQDDGTGYTRKQRLREEIDSPFRKVRVVFFGFSAGSALIALYFSLITLGKSFAGWEDTPPPNIAVSDVAINVFGVVICAFLTYRDIKAGEANLERIATGGQLASLRVGPADGSPSTSLAKFRQRKRVLIAAGGEEYIQILARSMLVVAPDIDRVNVVVVPVLLDQLQRVDAELTRRVWRDAQGTEDSDIAASDAVVCFPALSAPWTDYLSKEIKTATTQNIDPLKKGLGIYLKKNGRILRRATGQPDWASFVGTMDVMDGEQFGRPRF